MKFEDDNFWRSYFRLVKIYILGFSYFACCTKKLMTKGDRKFIAYYEKNKKRLKQDLNLNHMLFISQYRKQFHKSTLNGLQHNHDTDSASNSAEE